MELVNVALLILIAGELLILCTNLSKLRVELRRYQEKLTSEHAGIKK